MTEAAPVSTFEADRLDRQPFADLIGRYAVALAQDAGAMTGRVIAINARWGSGKSWVAQRLENHFSSLKGVGLCVYINTFQFDFHNDPFSVLTSAVLSKAREKSFSTTKLKRSATQVLKATLPTIAKGATRLGLSALGVDPGASSETASAIAKELSDAGASATEKALANMLESFEQTHEAALAFKTTLRQLADKANGALVVIVDELDRCRPSFALETLERIKHLFDVPGVVFLLFMHDKALHSAIEHTYGAGIDADEYLRKFITVTVDLPTVVGLTDDSDTQYFRAFLEACLTPQAIQTSREMRELVEAISSFAPCLNATLRDVEQVLLIRRLTKSSASGWEAIFAYVALLKVTQPLLFKRLRSSDPEAYRAAALQLERRWHADRTGVGPFTWAGLMFCADASRYTGSKTNPEPEVLRVIELLQGEGPRFRSQLGRWLTLLKLENVRA